MMASFIIAAVVILSILSGVAFCPPPPTGEQSKEAMVNSEVRRICNGESFKNFIKCEVIPGVSQGGSFIPHTVHTKIGRESGILFAAAKPGFSPPSGFTLIWKVTGAVKGSIWTLEEETPVYSEIRVVIKFHFDKDLLQNDKHHGEEEQNIQTLNTFGLAPARYVFENEKGRIKTEFIVMERIDGVTLSFYITMMKHIEDSERHDEETKLRLPELRLLYIHLETMLLLERLQKEKWRLCNLCQKHVMMRQSTKKGVRELAAQIRKIEQENDQMEKDDREAWIALQLLARSVIIKKYNKKDYYQTDNKHMVFIEVGKAQQERNPTYPVCSGPSDISMIFKHWKKKAEDKSNLHLTPMKQKLMEIFAPLADLQHIAADEEERKLKEVIGELRALEEEEKDAFIADLKRSREKKHGVQTAPGLPRIRSVPVLQRQQEVPPLLPKTVSSSGRGRPHITVWTRRPHRDRRRAYAGRTPSINTN